MNSTTASFKLNYYIKLRQQQNIPLTCKFAFPVAIEPKHKKIRQRTHTKTAHYEMLIDSLELFTCSNQSHRSSHEQLTGTLFHWNLSQIKEIIHKLVHMYQCSVLIIEDEESQCCSGEVFGHTEWLRRFWSLRICTHSPTKQTTNTTWFMFFLIITTFHLFSSLPDTQNWFSSWSLSVVFRM